MERSLGLAVFYGVVVHSRYLTHAFASSEYMEKQKKKTNDVRFAS